MHISCTFPRSATSIAARNRSSSPGMRCPYVSSVSDAFLWPRNRCTDLIDTPDEISADAQ